MTVHNGHWALWATGCREGVKLGYPSQTTFYTPARRSEEVTNVLPMMTLERDETIAQIIGEGVHIANNDEKIALIEFFGAYPGAPVEKGRRIAAMKRKLNRPRSGCYEVMSRGQRFVEGYVLGILANPDEKA